MIGRLVVASNEQSENGSFLLARVVLVEVHQMAVLGWDGHVAEVSIIAHSLRGRGGLSVRQPSILTVVHFTGKL